MEAGAAFCSFRTRDPFYPLLLTRWRTSRNACLFGNWYVAAHSPRSARGAPCSNPQLGVPWSSSTYPEKTPAWRWEGISPADVFRQLIHFRMATKCAMGASCTSFYRTIYSFSVGSTPARAGCPTWRTLRSRIHQGFTGSTSVRLNPHKQTRGPSKKGVIREMISQGSGVQTFAQSHLIGRLPIFQPNRLRL